MATVAAGSAADDNAAQTTTETVTVTAAPGAGSESAGDSSSSGPDLSSSSGAPITVIDPNAGASGEGSGTATASSEALASATGQPPGPTGAGETQDVGDASRTGGSSAAATTTAAPDNAQTRAAKRMVAAQCPTVLSARDIAGALGKSLPAQTIRVEDVANPDNKMTARTKCYYGTSDIGAARPLVVAIASFADTDAAAQQRDVTLSSEKAAGAKVSNSDVVPGDGEIKIMIRNGGLAVTQVGAATVSIAVADGVIGDPALRSALTLLTRSVISHVR
jgi:hypothetical protein